VSEKTMPDVNIDDGLPTVTQFRAKAECRTDLLPASQVEVAQRAFEQFLAGLSEVLPGYLFTPAEIRLLSVDQQLLSRALGESEHGSCTVAFAPQPFDHRIQLQLGRNFGSAALESVLGAPAGAVSLARESLTDVDFHILRDLIDLVAEELRKAWLATSRYSLEMVSTELTSTVNGSQSEDQGVVLLTAEVVMRECSGAIRLLVPSVLLRLMSTAEPDSATGGIAQRETLIEALAAASLDVEAVLDGARIQFRDLLGLEPGKILQLPHKTDAAIECQVNGIKKFRGELVSSGKSLGLQIQP
jgi:flagellar motor switch protein FliM